MGSARFTAPCSVGLGFAAGFLLQKQIPELSGSDPATFTIGLIPFAGHDAGQSIADKPLGEIDEFTRVRVLKINKGLVGIPASAFFPAGHDAESAGTEQAEAEVAGFQAQSAQRFLAVEAKVAGHIAGGFRLAAIGFHGINKIEAKTVGAFRGFEKESIAVIGGILGEGDIGEDNIFKAGPAIGIQRQGGRWNCLFLRRLWQRSHRG